SNATVLAFDAASRLVRWTASISGKQQLRWIAAGEEVAYFQVAPKDAGRVSSEAEPKLQRLDLIKGKWLSDLRISGNKKEESVIDAIARKGVVVVLTGSTTDDRWSPTLKTYRVSGFAEPGGRRIWTTSFSALGEVEPPAAFLWSAKRPNEAVPN